MTGVGAFVAIAIAGGSMGSGEEKTRTEKALSATTAPAEPAGAATTPAQAPAADPEPAAVTTAPAPPKPNPVKPVVYTGRGDKVLKIKKPGGDPDAPVLLYVKGNAGRDYMGITGKDSSGEMTGVPVNETDPVAGLFLLDIEEGQTTTRLVIQAVGPWRVELRPLASARRFDGKVSGSGHDVVYYTGAEGIAKITGNRSREYFGVQTYGVESGDVDIPVNTTDRYSGEVEWPADALVAITAKGAWTIKVS